MNFDRDQLDLFLSCRKGDLSQVQYLVEERDVDINAGDQWDSTPLYYACLCGHRDVVEYLLENGARCEASTFNGERCVYGALDDSIRQLLLNYKVITGRTKRRNLYDEFLRRLLENGDYSDITFSVHGAEFHVHKCILAARSSYFQNKFEGSWKNKSVVDTSHSLITQNAFKSLLQFIYTGGMETSINNVDNILRLATLCDLPLLKSELLDQIKKVTAFELSKQLGVRVKTVTLENSNLVQELSQDLGVLAMHAVPPALRDWVGGDTLPLLPPSPPRHLVDVCFIVGGHRFMAHKAIFAGRSEYFKALMMDHFCEVERYTDGAPQIHLRGVSPGVFAAVVHYIYTNTVLTQLPDRLLIELLSMADMYLLPGLQRWCGTALVKRLSPKNVLGRLRLARFYGLSQLEFQCTRYIAANFEKMKDMVELHDFIIQDAATVEDRQETDTIPIVDDIRYHIALAVQDYSAMSEAHDKLVLVDELLEKLGLDA